MSIAIIANTINGKSGLDRAISEMANSFFEEGFEVDVINLFNKNHAKPGFYINENVNKYYIWDVDVRNFSLGDLAWISKPGAGFTMNIPFLNVELSRRSILNLKWILKNYTENDLIIFTHPIQPYILNKFGWKLKTPTILQIHGNYEELHDLRNLLEEAKESIGAIQIITEGMRKGISKIVPEIPIYNIPNFYTHRINDSEYVINPHEFRIGFIGSFQKRKNQLGAIKFLLKLIGRKDVKASIKLVFFGNHKNAYGESIQAAVNSIGISDHVIFEGVKETHEIYNNIDCVLMLSESEGFSYVMVESCFYKKPLFLFDFNYGPADFIDDQNNGFISKYGNYDELVDKMVFAINNKDDLNHLIDRAYQDINNIFSRRNIINTYLCVFKNVRKTKRIRKSINCIKRDDLSINGVFISNNLLKIRVNFNKNLNFNDFDLFAFKNGEYFKADKINISKNIRSVTYEILSNINLTDSFIYILNQGCYLFLGVINKNSEIKLDYQLSSMNFQNNEMFYIREIDHEATGGGLSLALPFRGGVKNIVVNNNIKISPDNLYFKKSDHKNRLWLQLNEGAVDVIDIVGNFSEKFSIKFPDFSVAQINDSLKEIESSLNLFDAQEHGVFWWELIRANAFDVLMEGGLKWARFEVSPNFYNLLNVPKLDESDILNLRRKKALIFSLPVARIGAMDDWWESYFSTDKRDIGFIRLTPGGMVTGAHFEKDFGSNNVFFLTPPDVKKIVSVHSSANRAILFDLHNKLYEYFGVHVNLGGFLINKVNKFIAEYDFYKNILLNSEIEDIYIPSAYWQPGLLAAAADCNINAYDLQYSAILKNHPNYWVPYDKRKYKDRGLYVRQNSIDVTDLSKNRPIIEAYKNELEASVAARKIDCSNCDVIIFISQGRLTNAIAPYVIDAKNKYPEKEVVLAMHPTENINDKFLEKYKNLGVTLVRGAENSVQQFPNKKIKIVGVYSSALLDLHEMGMDISIIKLPGWDFYKSWIDSGVFSIYK